MSSKIGNMKKDIEMIDGKFFDKEVFKITSNLGYGASNEIWKDLFCQSMKARTVSEIRMPSSSILPEPKGVDQV